MYSEQVLDHFQHPRNAGDLPGADASVEVENPACGDVLRLAANLRQGKLLEVRFLARGCVAAVAASSAVTELLTRRTLAEADALQLEDVLAALGGLPNESLHATHLAIDATRALVAQLQRLQRSSPGRAASDRTASG
jgi:nitrogen fixation NifU-like protein